MRGHRSPIIPTAALILAVAAGAGECAEKVVLRLNLKQGQTFRIALSVRNSGSASVKNQTYGTTESLNAGLAFRVESVDSEGNARMNVTFENVSYSLNQPGAPQLGQVMSAFFAGLNGRSFGLEVGPTGEIRSVTGIEAAVDAALTSLANYPEQVRTLASTFAAQTISEPMWKSAMSTVFSVLPPGPVEIGERWSRSSSTSAQGAAETTQFYYKILERADGVAKVKVFADVKSLQREPLPGMRLVLAGRGEGTAQIDEASGLVIRSSSKSELRGRVSGAPGQSGELPVAVTSTTTISRY